MQQPPTRCWALAAHTWQPTAPNLHICRPRPAPATRRLRPAHQPVHRDPGRPRSRQPDPVPCECPEEPGTADGGHRGGDGLLGLGLGLGLGFSEVKGRGKAILSSFLAAHSHISGARETLCGGQRRDKDWGTAWPQAGVLKLADGPMLLRYFLRASFESRYSSADSLPSSLSSQQYGRIWTNLACPGFVTPAGGAPAGRGLCGVPPVCQGAEHQGGVVICQVTGAQGPPIETAADVLAAVAAVAGLCMQACMCLCACPAAAGLRRRPASLALQLSPAHPLGPAGTSWTPSAPLCFQRSSPTGRCSNGRTSMYCAGGRSTSCRASKVGAAQHAEHASQVHRLLRKLKRRVEPMPGAWLLSQHRWLPPF